jgi:hypothetical protein
VPGAGERVPGREHSLVPAALPAHGHHLPPHQPYSHRHPFLTGLLSNFSLSSSLDNTLISPWHHLSASFPSPSFPYRSFVYLSSLFFLSPLLNNTLMSLWHHLPAYCHPFLTGLLCNFLILYAFCRLCLILIIHLSALGITYQTHSHRHPVLTGLLFNWLLLYVFCRLCLIVHI